MGNTATTKVKLTPAESLAKAWANGFPKADSVLAAKKAADWANGVDSTDPTVQLAAAVFARITGGTKAKPKKKTNPSAKTQTPAAPPAAVPAAAAQKSEPKKGRFGFGRS